MLCVIKDQFVTTSEPWPVTVLLTRINRLLVRPLQLNQIRLDLCFLVLLANQGECCQSGQRPPDGHLCIAQRFAEGCLVEAGTSFNQIIVRSSPAELGRGETDASTVCIEDIETKDPNNARPSPNFDGHMILCNGAYSGTERKLRTDEFTNRLIFFLLLTFFGLINEDNSSLLYYHACPPPEQNLISF